jgi:hypothetical protein
MARICDLRTRRPHWRRLVSRPSGRARGNRCAANEGAFAGAPFLELARHCARWLPTPSPCATYPWRLAGTPAPRCARRCSTMPQSLARARARGGVSGADPRLVPTGPLTADWAGRVTARRVRPPRRPRWPRWCAQAPRPRDLCSPPSGPAAPRRRSQCPRAVRPAPVR